MFFKKTPVYQKSTERKEPSYRNIACHRKINICSNQLIVVSNNNSYRLPDHAHIIWHGDIIWNRVWLYR